MISTAYQVVTNMEANLAEKIAIQYYDEAKEGVVSIRYGQYAQDIHRAAGLLLHLDPDIRGRKVCLLARNSYDYLVNIYAILLTGAVLAILISVSSSVAMQNASSQLESTVRANLAGISRSGGSLSFSEGFSFTRNGVYTLVYSSSGALLAGQPPLDMPQD